MRASHRPPWSEPSPGYQARVYQAESPSLVPQGILEYNFRCFRDSLGQLFQLPSRELNAELGHLSVD